MRRWALAACLLLAPSGCFGDGEEEERREARVQGYALAVERITDDVDDHGTAALTTLNRLRDGSLRPRAGSRKLDRLADRTARAQERLKQLVAPKAARISADDLEGAVSSLELNLRRAATDVRLAERERVDPFDAALSGSNTVLLARSGVSALSRAVRALAVESVD